MNLLVTGGAGFIGANFVHYWFGKYPGAHVRVLDNLTYAGNLESLSGIKARPGFSFVKGDICDYTCAYGAMHGIDTVVHFAAETHVDRSLSGLEAEKLFLRTNVEGTATLLHAARDAGVKRFHHISTDEVFGDLDFNSPRKFHEDYPYEPHNPYSVSKAAADFMVRTFARTSGFPITISNCSNNYGPYQTPEKLIPRSIALLLAGKKIALYTDAQGNPGKNVRDWIHAEDHARAVEAILLEGSAGDTYCIGGNAEISNADVIGMLIRIMTKLTGTPYSEETHVDFVKDRPGHDRRYAMDTSKIERSLGWRPRFSFEQGLESTVGWYLSQTGREWLRAVDETTSDVRAGQSSTEMRHPRPGAG